MILPLPRYSNQSANFKLLVWILPLLTLILFSSNYAIAQSELQSLGATTICEGESTTIQVIINASVGPYTVIYSDGTNDFTVNNYNSVGDPESSSYGGDPISISPTAPTSYTLSYVYDYYGTSLPVSSTSLTITVNPLPTNLVVTINPASPVCPGVDFTISASAINGSVYELWDELYNTKISDLPYTTSISVATNYTVKAISSEGCSITESLSIELESTPPTISGTGAQTINTAVGTCDAILPDYTGMVTVNDNCSSVANISLSQSPAPNTVLSGHNTVQTVTITATDQANNSNDYSFTVTVIDAEGPTVNGCPSGISADSDTGDCGAIVTWTEPTATDNCTSSGNLVWNKSHTPDTYFPVGTTTVTYTAEDQAGNISSTCSFTVTVTDTEDPTITGPANISIGTDLGDCGAAVTYSTPVGTDNCSGAITSQTAGLSSGSFFPIGTTTNTFEVTDAAGLKDTYSFTVTVTDDEKPTIVDLPSDITVDNDPGTCGAVVTWTEPISDDNCTGHSIGQIAGISNGETFPVGTTIVTYRATDAKGNTSDGSFTVTVNDIELPEITCPGDIAVSADTGESFAVVSYTTPVGTDICSGAVTTQTEGLPSGSDFPVGVTLNEFVVVDASGNKDTCSFTVTVSDGEGPVIADCPGNIEQSNDAGACAAVITWEEPTATDNQTASGDIIWIKSHEPGESFPVGETTVTYIAVDESNNQSAACSFTVTVNDTQKPVISGCPSNISRTSSAGLCTAVVSWTEPTASDNCTTAGNLIWHKSHTPGSTFPSGETTVTYSVEDEAGNVSEVCSFTVTVTDDQKPVISHCPSDISVSTDAGECGAYVSWAEPTVSDNCTDETGLIWTKSHLPGDLFTVGTTIVTYTVKDASNNISTPCTFKVTVTDDIAPVVNCSPATIYLNASGIATLTVADINNGSYDNCTEAGNLILTLDKTSFNCADVGNNQVTLTVKDGAGNQNTCTTTVTVIDNTAPTLTATAGTVTSSINASYGYCYYIINGSEFDPIVTDNCSSTMLSYTITGATELAGTGSLAGIHLNTGENTISWLATDGSSNQTSTPITFTKTVADNQAPVIGTKANQTRNTDTGCGYTAVGNEFDIAATDNCGIPVLSYTINGGPSVEATTLEGVVFSTGINSIVWKASDGTNTSSRSFKLTVTDDDGPTISSIDNITQNVDDNLCTAVVAWTEPTASDNCTLASFSQILGPVSGSAFPVGTTVVKYKATDTAGNISEMSFTVTIRDETAPEIICPSGSTNETPFERDADIGFCFYTVDGDEFDPVVTDGCTFTLTNSFDNGSSLAGKQLPVGNHTIIWTAADNAGNLSTCTIYVQVHDTQDPTFNQPKGETTGSYTYNKYTDPGKCYYTVPGTGLDLSSISDNCSTDVPTYVVTKNGSTVFTGSNTLAGLQFPKDAENAYTVTWTLSDVNGNTVIADPFTILVTDNQAPSFVCYGNESRTIPSDECSYIINGTEFDPTGLTDNCDIVDDLTISYTLDGSEGTGTSLAGTELSGGTHIVIWTITDLAGNAATCTFKIYVYDPVFPTISTIADQERDAPASDCYYTAVGNEFDPIVSDNCPSVMLTNNQNNTSTLAGFDFPVGITVVVWTAKDASGNVVTMQYQVDIKDVTPPSYDIPETVSKNTDANGCYYTVSGNEFDPQNVIDNCTSANYNITNDYNDYKSLAYEQFPVGTTIVTWTVTDYYGNEEIQTTEITVTDNVLPTINCSASSYTRVVDQGENYYTVGLNEFKPVATDNCALTSYTNSINGTSSLNGIKLTAGQHSIVWTAVDAAGNSTDCTVTVNIVTDLYPSVTCLGDQSVYNDSDNCDYTVSGTEFDASSTTAGATLINDFNNSASLAGAAFPVGTTLVTWTASQTVAGTLYSNSCSFFVFVYDNEDPVITPAANINTTTNSGCYATSVSLGTPTVDDNCGVYTYSNNAPSSYSIGTTNVTWWIEDIHGNTSTTVQTVTVVDDDSPSVSCPGNFCRQEDEGQSYYTVNGHEFDPYGYWDCSGISSVTNSYNGLNTLSGEQLSVGENTITWTITDNATPTQNVTTCTSVITINNDDPPSVTCRGNATKYTDDGECYYTVQGTEFDVTSTSSSPTLTYTVTGATDASGSSLAGILLSKGTNYISWVADDGAGNTNECCSFTVYVIDNQDPVVTWPEDVTVYVDEGSCTATDVDLGAPTATDNCDEPTAINYYRYPSGTTFAIGTTNIYWQAHDTRGNTVTHTQTVTVIDDIPPVINCPSETYYREFDNKYVEYYTIIGNEFKPSVSDNCTLTSYINNENNSSYLNSYRLPLGDHTIRWTATDASSNTDHCDVNVVVVETFIPEISCPENTTEFTSSSSCSYIVSGTDLDAVFTSSTVIPGRTLIHDYASAPSNETLDGAELPKGNTVINWTARQTIGGVEYTNTCSTTITIVDNVAPVVTSTNDTITVYIDPGVCTKTMTLDEPTVEDNCSELANISITNNAPDPFLLGTNNVRWIFTDGSGNSTVYVQKVIVLDNEGPVISNCPASDITELASGSNCQAIVSWPALIATDECSGVKSFTSTHGPGTLFDFGTTQVTYTAIDYKDNVSTCTFNVIVTDEEPTINCIGNQTRNTNSGLCSYLVLGNELDPDSYSDNCSIASITWSFEDAETHEIRTGNKTLSGVTIPRGDDPGITTITWTATDHNGNETQCSFDLTIVDDEAPVIVVPGNQTRYVDADKGYYTIQGGEFDDVTATDNCGIVTKLENEFQAETLDGLHLKVGLNSIDWYAVDDHGNTSTESFYVTVIDNEPPVVYNPEANITAYTSGSCEAVVNYTEPQFIDYGTIVTPLTITISPVTVPPGSTFPVGETEVTYMVVDSSGNTLSYPITITVIDDEDPTITCPSGSPFSRIVDEDKGYYTAQGNEFDPTYSDNCDVAVTNNFNNSSSLAGATLPVGTTTITWTVTDDSNNSVSCQIKVTVEDNEPPVIQNCPDATLTAFADPGECAFIIPGAEYDPYGFSDNNGLAKLTYQIDSEPEVGTDMNTTLGGVAIPVGTTSKPTTIVVWRVYDFSGNSSIICATEYTITDSEAPMVTTTSNQVKSTDTGESDYTVKETDSWDPEVTDNCTIETITYQIDGGDIVGTDATTTIAGEVFEVGTHSVVWMATDIYGNSNTGSYLVTVIDDEAPAVVCNDVTVQLDAIGNYTLSEDDIDAIALGAEDPSGIASSEVSPSSFNCTDVGDNSVILTVTDIYGNKSTCEAIVTVEDITLPTVVCQNTTVQLDVLGQVTILASQLDGGSSDACGIQSISASTTTFSCSNIGDNNVTLTVTDNNGNTNTCTAVVTVEDNISPSAVCNPLTVYLDETGNYALTSTDIDGISLGSTDNCSLTNTVTPNTFDCNAVGENTVTLRVTDGDGNYDECTTTITVVDNNPPEAVCQDITVQLDENGDAEITVSQIDNGSNDECGEVTLAIDKTSFDCSNLGADPAINTVTLTVTDVNGNESTCTSLVTVEDPIAPVVTCAVNENQDVNTDDDLCSYTHHDTNWDASATDACNTVSSLTYALSGATTVDDAPGNTTLNGATFNKGVTTVTWKAVDVSGNDSSCSFTVTVTDNQNPNAITKNITVELDASGNVTITGTDVSNGSNDACGIQSIEVNPSSFNCGNLGENEVTLTVTDTNNNIATATANVTVEDNINPVAACKDITVYLDASGVVTITGEDIDNGSTDNCSIANKSVSPDAFSCSDIGSPVEVTLTVTDPAGNSNTCTAYVTVLDEVDPTPECKNITVQLDASGNASISASQIDNGSYDACGIADLSASKITFTCSDLGLNTVTLTVTDNNSNDATCNATVTVEDTVKPTYSFCPVDQTVTTDNDQCIFTHGSTAWDAIATDNCTLSSLTYSLSGETTAITGENTSLNGQVFNKGETTVTWLATDQSGNTNTCTFIVTVNDEQDPTAVCQSFTAQLNRNGEIEVFPSDINNGSDDNCGITLYEISKDNLTYSSSITYSCTEIGTPTAYLRVTDEAGNTDFCSTTITVEDKQAPTLDDLSDREEITDEGECTYTFSGTDWDPTDNCGTVSSKTYTLSGATSTITLPNTTLDGQVFEKGITTVTWTATDDSGNSAETTINVVVTDEQNPEFTSCPDDITQVVASSGATSATVSSIPLPEYDDNCSVTKLTYSFSGATTQSEQESVINTFTSYVFNVGTTTVTYTAYDDANNFETCTFTITINAQDGAIIVSKTSLETTEDLDSDSFTVELGSAPTGTVVIAVSSDDTTEGTASVSQVTFNSSNWDTPQTITVTGVNDDVDDDDISYHVNLAIDQASTDDLSGYENASSVVIDAVNIDNDEAGITVSSISRHTTEAGQTATFTIRLNTEPLADVSFDLTTSDATEGTVTSAGTITFTPSNWNTPQTVTVTGVDDVIDDGDFSYQIDISNATSTDPKYSGLFATQVDVVNNDNDTAGFTVTPVSLTTSETGTTATYTIVLTSKPATDSEDYVVVVDIASSDETEGTISPSQLTFTASNWDSPQAITVTGVDDNIVDGKITYLVNNTVNSGSTTDSGYQSLDPSDVSVSNTDDDSATLSIADVTQLETNSGTTDFVFTVTHAGSEVDGGYSVTYYTQNGTAKAPTDFTGAGGTINFTTGAIGETQTITISVNGDEMVERNETFSVVLNSVIAPGKNITIDAAEKTATGTITNDDNATLSINDVSIAEGNAGTTILNFTVTLDVDVEDGLTINYATADGTATTANSDYGAKTGTVTFSGTGGETHQIGITINGDEIVELDENFQVNLSNIVPVSAPESTISFADDTGVGTITNDDNAVLSITGFTVNESIGTANFTITLNKEVQDEFTIDFETSDNTALAGTDYNAVSTTTLTFGGPNDLEQTVSVTILDGDIAEPTETLYGTISNLIDPKGQNIAFSGGGSSAQATGTITDNDYATIAIDDVPVNEADGKATFTFTLSGNIQDSISFYYTTADNTANSGSDYTSTSGTIIFEDESNDGTQISIDVPILENNIAEATETYYVNLSVLYDANQSGVSIFDNQGLGTITDNDTVHLVLNNFAITETDGTQTANFYVSRDIASQSTVTLLFSTTEGTAIASGDFTAQTNTSVLLSASSTDNTDIPVTIMGDDIAEPTETFDGTISIDETNGQQIVISTETVTSTIYDDDEMQITLEDKMVTETDENQSINYVVSTNISAQEAVTLSFSTSDGTAVDGNDYLSQSATEIIIPALTTSVNIPVDVLGDLITEPQESFFGTISITDDNSQQVSISDGNAEYTINDNDPATLAISGFEVDEDAGTANFTITLSRDVQNTFTVDFTTSDITDEAVAGSDYTGVSTTLTFGSNNDLVQTVPVTIVDDSWVEPSETLLGTLSNLAANDQAVTIPTPTAISTINDNDAASVAIDSVSLGEADGPAIFTVTLTGNIQDVLTVDFTTNDNTATDPSDYTEQTGTVTFTAGSLSGSIQQISVPIINDEISEPVTETYTVDLSNISSTGSATISNAVGLGTITDNDPVTAINLTGFTESETDANVPQNFVASMDIEAQENIIISFTTTEGTALDGSDFTGQSAEQYTILAGQKSVDIPVVVIGDLVNEPQESFTGRITLVNTNGQNITVGTDEATATINDNDATIISISGFSVNESTGTADFTVSLDHSVQNAFTVDFETADNTALAGSGLDYTAIATTTLNFGDTNPTSQMVSVTINDDNWVEPTEELIGRILNLVPNSQDITLNGGGSTSEAIGEIIDNDEVTISVDNVTINENDGTATFTVTLTGDIQDDLTVDYATNDVSAIAGSDYTTVNGTLTYDGSSTGTTTHTVSVPILTGDIAEPTETFTIDLSNISSTGDASFADNQGV
ncbi:MAG: HYR domain-containing protein, partial [Draconibacterium sp.]